MIDGAIFACVSEERFSRVKNDERYPRHAIEWVLRGGGVTAPALDAVVFAGRGFDAKAVLVRKYSTFSVHDRLREQTDFWYPKLCEGKSVSYLDVFRDKIDAGQPGEGWDALIRRLAVDGAEVDEDLGQEFRRRTVCAHLGLAPEKVSFVDHHAAHGYYAYYASPFRNEPVAILTADAWGDHCNATVSLAHDGRIERLSVSTDFIAARLYRSVTLLLGMKPDEHEYKVMGLAGYAKDDYIQGPLNVFAETQYVHDLGFEYRHRPSDLFFHFKDRLQGYRFDSIAGAVQAYTEGLLTRWAANVMKSTSAARVVVGGGAAMNVKAMMRIGMLAEVDDLFVCPSPSDESLAIGAAYVHMHDVVTAQGRNPDAALKSLDGPYLGPGLCADDVASELVQFREDSAFTVTEHAAPSDVARILAGGMIVGRCAGRSEFGARALGNRSIVADPRRIDSVRKINDHVKSRDFWMPFAPTILSHRSDDYLTQRKGMKAPYMTQAFATTPLANEELPAALHRGDLTCRPQLLEKAANPPYHDLVRAFEELTGVGGVLNTSFNLHGEPIVQSAAEAARVFRVSGLDALILDDTLIAKVGQPA